MEFAQYVNFVLDFVGIVGETVVGREDGCGAAGGGFFNGDETAIAEDCFVDEAVAASTEKFLIGEAIGGGFEVAVIELLDFDGFFVVIVRL